MGLIPREHTYWQNMYSLNALHCKSLWIKASAKCVNYKDLHITCRQKIYIYREVTYCQVCWPILKICALHLTYPKCTHTAVNTHTHTVNTHSEQWAAIYAAAPGEQLGVRCLAQGHLVVVLSWRERCTFTPPPPPPTIPAGLRLELTTFA